MKITLEKYKNIVQNLYDCGEFVASYILATGLTTPIKFEGKSGDPVLSANGSEVWSFLDIDLINKMPEEFNLSGTRACLQRFFNVHYIDIYTARYLYAQALCVEDTGGWSKRRFGKHENKPIFVIWSLYGSFNAERYYDNQITITGNVSDEQSQ